MDITTTQLPLVLIAIGLGGWGAVKLYRIIARTLRSRARRIIVGTLLGGAVPTAAGVVSYWVGVAIDRLGTLASVVFDQF